MTSTYFRRRRQQRQKGRLCSALPAVRHGRGSEKRPTESASAFARQHRALTAARDASFDKVLRSSYILDFQPLLGLVAVPPCGSTAINVLSAAYQLQSRPPCPATAPARAGFTQLAVV